MPPATAPKLLLVDLPEEEPGARYRPPALDGAYAEDDTRGFRLRIHGKGVKMRMPVTLR